MDVPQPRLVDEPDAPTLSIVIPSFNHSQYIRRTIDSILRQPFKQVELIVVDGGSKDGTVDILCDYMTRFPDRFRFVSEPDDGQSDALNKGIAMARGEIIGWQNADDYYLPGAFEKPVSYLLAHPEVAVVYGEREEHDDMGRVRLYRSVPYDFATLLDADYIPSQAVFMRKDAVVSCGGVSTHFHYAMDYDLWLRLGLKYHMHFLPGILGVWNALPEAKTVSASWKSATEHVHALQSIAKDPAFPAALSQRGAESVRRHALMALQESLVAGERENAVAMLEIVTNPDGSLGAWSFYIDRLLLRRVLLDTWRRPVLRKRLDTVPRRTASLLQVAGISDRDALKQTIVLYHLFACLRSIEERRALLTVAHAVRALTLKPLWLLATLFRAVAVPVLEGGPSVQITRLRAVWLLHRSSSKGDGRG